MRKLCEWAQVDAQGNVFINAFLMCLEYGVEPTRENQRELGKIAAEEFQKLYGRREVVHIDPPSTAHN